jgi:hypothetical protein
MDCAQGFAQRMGLRFMQPWRLRYVLWQKTCVRGKQADRTRQTCWPALKRGGAPHMRRPR